MKLKYLSVLPLAALLIHISSCNSSKQRMDDVSPEEQALFDQKGQDTVAIASKESEYEIIIIEPGFYTWLQSIARPEGYYSQSFLENRNQIYVMNWNQRAMDPLRYGTHLYEMQINYESNIDYGYEVNYKLYNYFIYFQRKYRQRLGPFVPRI
ncbi:MAG: DUF6146 family protein [Flavobacteriaceae bacterium]